MERYFCFKQIKRIPDFSGILFFVPEKRGARLVRMRRPPHLHGAGATQKNAIRPVEPQTENIKNLILLADDRLFLIFVTIKL